MNPPSPLQRVFGAVLGVVLFVAALVFASVLIAVVAVGAMLVWAWLWWRTRDLPKPPRGGVVIDGEYRVTSDPTSRDDRGER